MLLEVVLGLNNVIFISIMAARLLVHPQKKARRLNKALEIFLCNMI